MTLTTEQQKVLAVLKEGQHAAVQIGHKLKRRREHVSRVLKQLQYRSMVECDAKIWSLVK